MEKYPVCNKTLESQFALNGHLRLKKDPDHISFYKQKNKSINKKIFPLSEDNILSKTGVRTIDLLEKFLNQSEKIYEEEKKEDRFIEKLRNMIKEERNVDLNKERERIKEEVIHQYQSNINNAIDKEKQELQQKYIEEIDSMKIKIKNEYREEYHKKYAIYLSCIYCKDKILLSPGSELNDIINSDKMFFTLRIFIY